MEFAAERINKKIIVEKLKCWKIYTLYTYAVSLCFCVYVTEIHLISHQPHSEGAGALATGDSLHVLWPGQPICLSPSGKWYWWAIPPHNPHQTRGPFSTSSLSSRGFPLPLHLHRLWDWCQHHGWGTCLKARDRLDSSLLSDCSQSLGRPSSRDLLVHMLLSGNKSPRIPVILGYPWLQHHNPHLDWTTGSILGWSSSCQQVCLRQAVTPLYVSGPKSTQDVAGIPPVHHDFSKARALALPPHCPPHWFFFVEKDRLWGPALTTGDSTTSLLRTATPFLSSPLLLSYCRVPLSSWTSATPITLTRSS